jgi:hypothetical protein
MAKRVWEWSELTPEVVRAWGYDDELILLEQDEDLLLYDVDFIPVLLDLATDDRCPKQDCAFRILCQFCREKITRGGEAGADVIRAARSAIKESARGRPQEWYKYVGRLLAYTIPSGPLDEAAARGMAEELLLGIAGRVGDVTESDSVRPGWWRFTLRTSVTEHIDVCQSSGEFVYHRGRA